MQVLDREDVPCAPVLTRKEVIRHPQILANDLLLESDHPIAGRLRQTRPAPQFSKTPSSLRHHAPALGADSEAVLSDADFSNEEIHSLVSAGVVTTGNKI